MLPNYQVIVRSWSCLQVYKIMSFTSFFQYQIYLTMTMFQMTYFCRLANTIKTWPWHGNLMAILFVYFFMLANYQLIVRSWLCLQMTYFVWVVNTIKTWSWLGNLMSFVRVVNTIKTWPWLGHLGFYTKLLRASNDMFLSWCRLCLQVLLFMSFGTFCYRRYLDVLF